MEENKITCRLCLGEEFQQNSVPLTQEFPFKNRYTPSSGSKTQLIHIIRKCFDFMDMTQMIYPTPCICCKCYNALNQFLSLKYKLIQSELESNKTGPLKCRACGDSKLFRNFFEGSNLHYFYLNMVHKYFNPRMKLISLCTECCKLIKDSILFNNQCYTTAKKINIFINTFHVEKGFNKLNEVRHHFSRIVWHLNKSTNVENTFGANSTNIGNSTRLTTSSVPQWHLNESTNVGYGGNSTTNSSVPNWHFNESTNVGSTFGDNSANIGNSTGVSNNSTISGNGRQNTQIGIINLTEINIINNNNTNDDNSQGLNGTVESTTTNVVTKESTNKATKKQLKSQENFILKLLKKNYGSYEIKRPKDSEKLEKPQENMVIDFTEDEPPENVENVSENSNDSNVTLTEIPVEFKEVTNSKKIGKDKTKVEKRHWNDYYYNCLLGTMKLFYFEFDHSGRPLNADWNKISKAFHIPFTALGIKFDVKKGWSRLTKMSMDFLSNGKVKNSSQKSLLKKVIDYTNLVVPESSKVVNVVRTLEVLSSEEDRTMDVPGNSPNVNNNHENNEDTSEGIKAVEVLPIKEEEKNINVTESCSNINNNDDFYQTITINDDSSDTDIEPYENTNNKIVIKKEPTKRKSLDLDTLREEINIEELLKSDGHVGLEDILKLETVREEINIEELIKSDGHVGLEDILKLSNQEKKARIKDEETVDYKIVSDVIILD
ncbi:unnamed protein product [Brassicogethes aeneus]|uniref:ZAD domain-containing protein n=1 Tax=Brassicogethes aeneus TaxID=1431903 RepID=A0A9P0FE87_BRAAE|nr:unnamed protein product [Brassicogethes aeneus]